MVNEYQLISCGKVNPVCLVSVAAITGGFTRHCKRCAYWLTATRRAGPSMQTLGPLLQYTGCTITKQRYTSYRGYFSLLTLLHHVKDITCDKNQIINCFSTCRWSSSFRCI